MHLVTIKWHRQPTLIQTVNKIFMACRGIVVLLCVALVTGLLNVTPVQSSEQLLYVCIDVVSGEDSKECLNFNTTVKTCQSLSFVARNLTRTNSVNIEIVSEWLNLTKPIEFRSYTHLTISGFGNTTLHCNESNAGLAFVRVKNLTSFNHYRSNYGLRLPLFSLFKL